MKDYIAMYKLYGHKILCSGVSDRSLGCPQRSSTKYVVARYSVKLPACAGAVCTVNNSKPTPPSLVLGCIAMTGSWSMFAGYGRVPTCTTVKHCQDSTKLYEGGICGGHVRIA